MIVIIQNVLIINCQVPVDRFLLAPEIQELLANRVKAYNNMAQVCRQLALFARNEGVHYYDPSFNLFYASSLTMGNYL